VPLEIDRLEKCYNCSVAIAKAVLLSIKASGPVALVVSKWESNLMMSSVQKGVV